MDYLEGITLKEYLKTSGSMIMEQVLKVLMPIMDDLGKVHEMELVHRGISPDNIMILKDGPV